MFTGLYPHEHGSVSGLHPLERTQTTLAEVLSDAGFRTAAFVSGYTMIEKWGLDQGFGSYDDRFTGMSRWGGQTERRAEKWLRERSPEERFFLFVHLYDAHGPYRTTPAYRGLFRSEQPGPRLEAIPAYQQLKTRKGEPLEHLNDYVDRYDALIRYEDDLVARLLGAVDLETTAVVIVADHGENLNERVGPLNHGGSVFEEEIRIPLLLVGPGIRARRIEASVETVDLLPTLLDWLGVERPSGAALRGRSWLPLLRGREPDLRQTPERVVFSSSVVEAGRYVHLGYELDSQRSIHAARAGPWKLIFYPGVAQDYLELYDLKRDPLERRSVAEQHPEVRDRLLTALERWNPGYRDAMSMRTPEEKDREALRALGYIEP